MSAVTRSNTLNLTLMKEREEDDIKKEVAPEEASQAIALIDGETKGFHLEGKEFPGGYAVVINVDTAALDENNSLERFLLTRVQIPTNLLRSVLQHQNLRYLSLTEGALCGDDLVNQLAVGLEGNQRVTTLNLMSNHFSENQLNTIIKVLNSTKIEKFLITGNDCNTSSMQLLADSLPQNPHFKEISLCPRHVDHHYPENIRQIIQETKALVSIKLYPVASGAEPSHLLTQADLTHLLEAVKGIPPYTK